MDGMVRRSSVRVWLASFALLASVLAAIWLGGASSAQPLVSPTRTPVPTPNARQYEALGQMRLPWDRNDADPRNLTDDWVDHWHRPTPGARGLAWDFARNPFGTPIADTPVLAPCSGYVSAVVGGTNGGYGNYVDIQTEDGWGVRLAHLADGTAIRSECSGLWIPRGVPVGNLGNTGREPPYAYHTHLELRWHDVAPPMVSGDTDRGYRPRLPAHSQPFGVPSDQLRNPTTSGIPVHGNQQVYAPEVQVVWPYDGIVIPKEPGPEPSEKSRLLLTTQEWSSLHEYRWTLRRAESTEVLASTEWRRAEDGAPGLCELYRADLPLSELGRGEYVLEAEARFPDLRRGERYRGRWLTGPLQTVGFAVLDLDHPLDRLRWMWYRIFQRPAYAAEDDPRRIHANPPPPLSPSMQPEPELVPNRPEDGFTEAEDGSMAAVQALLAAIDRRDVEGVIEAFPPRQRWALRLMALVGKPLLNSSQLDLDFEALEYEVISVAGEEAVVRVAGKAIVRSLEDGSVLEEYDEYYVDVPTVRVGGHWYVDVELSELVELWQGE